jgi:hypothetical protein
MSVTGTDPVPGALKLPPYSLDVEALDLGGDVKAVGLELVETENREPLKGKEATEIWAAIFPALCGDEPFTIDFFSHLDRVKEFCKSREIPFREAAERCLVVHRPSREQIRVILERFEGETFGLRAGYGAAKADPTLEEELSKRGLDAYQPAYSRYTFCAICDPRDAWITLLSETLWPSEIIRRLRPAVAPFDLYIARPN